MEFSALLRSMALHFPVLFSEGQWVSLEAMG